ncbi:MAG: SUMF1/EgtB/PvdO family nonheme iron enzyme [Chthoniobacter sp.]|nr:SUMF1/EgtB/PvdO family nonheme iron enzyme [Chthoniobacter sp.]
MRVLLVDDDTGVIQSLLAVLKSVPGYDVRVGTSGERALENADALGGVDLLITDVVMEPMDGFSLRAEIQQRYPHARTILISGYDLSDYAEQLAGCQLLTKPIEPQALLAAIEQEFGAPPEPEPEPVPKPAPMPIARPVAVAAPRGPQRAVARPGVPAQPSARPGPGARPSPAARPAPMAARTAPAGAPGGRNVRTGGPAPQPAVSAQRPAAVARAGVQPVIAVAARAPEAVVTAALVAAAEPESDSLVGQLLGAYQIQRRLGAGRWGTVYAAVQTAINRQVALKVLDATRASDPDARTRFISDARAKAHVQHPSTQAVYEAGEAAGHIFYAHEFVDGHTMAEIAAGGGKLDEVTGLKVLRTAAEGLAYLASRSIPHAAPQAGSIYLAADGSPRLANLATHGTDEQLPIGGEIQALGQILIAVLPPLAKMTSGLRELLRRMVQPGPQAFAGWGQLLVAVKALEPKIVPLDAAKISAQDRAAVAAVAQLRKQQQRSLYINLATFITMFGLVVALAWYGYRKFFASNERDMGALIHIEAGEFLFGSGDPVTLPEFWIDKYEVTYGQYAKFVDFLKKNPDRAREFDDPRQPTGKTTHIPKNWEIFYSNAKSGHPVHSVPIDLNCPVMEVDWWDAAAYAKWKGRELPTEQEWEKAARGTKGFIYPWGEDPAPKKANSNADHKPNNPAAPGTVDGFNFWNPVDAIKGDKSPFGVIGMAGNVAEWIAWDPAKKQPSTKGGSYSASDLRLDRSGDLDPASVFEHIGFRTVTHTPPVPK